MSYRSNDHKGNAHIPANAAILGYRLVPDMSVADAIEVFTESEQINEWAAAVRRHPSWNPALENDLRFQADPEWTTEEIRFARTVLIRALRAFGELAHPGLTRFRDDGRVEVADHGDAAHLYCEIDDWCILEAGHPGDCNGDRELWLGPDVLYPATELVDA